MSYNGYIRCLDNANYSGSFTVGKVYKVVNGQFYSDKHIVVGGYWVKTFNDLQNNYYGKWEEVEIVKNAPSIGYEIGDEVLLAPLEKIFGDTKPYKIKDKIQYPWMHEYEIKGLKCPFRVDEIIGKVVPKNNKKWMEREIDEAKRIVINIIQNLAFEQKTLIFYIGEHFVTCKKIEPYDYGEGMKVLKTTKAVPKGRDVFNKDIGMCVAACKAAGKPIPSFILNK